MATEAAGRMSRVPFNNRQDPPFVNRTPEHRPAEIDSAPVRAIQ
jgi:hypothetical protein